MRIAHLIASPFFGGPEKQVLTLATEMRGTWPSFFMSFAESGRARPFLEEARKAGFEAIELCENWPHYFRSSREIATLLQKHQARLLCTSGYKPDIIGLRGARMAGIPAVAIAHGWTGATRKVRLNETLDRWVMRRFDAVVSVSEGQADKVRRAGVSPTRMVTIPNAVPVLPQQEADPACRAELVGLFPHPPQLLVAAAGRLSPEKGFDVLIDAMAQVLGQTADVGCVLFGEGPLRTQLQQQIDSRQLSDRIVLAGFRADLGCYLPTADLLVISSHTEGLPVILLEALAAGVPVVATTVGGIPEVIEEGVQGFLVPPANPAALAERITAILQDDAMRATMRQQGPLRIATHYSTALQAERYAALFETLVRPQSLA